MKILFLTRLYYPHIGGVETHVKNVSEILTQRGQLVTIVTEQYDKNLPLHEIINGIEIFRIPVFSQEYIKKFVIWSWFLLHINILMRSYIVHCHDVFFWYLPFRFLLPFKKIFVTFHGHETRFPPSEKSILIRKLTKNLSLGSINVGKYIEKWYGTKANYTIYGGVEVQNSKLKNPNHSSRVKILFVGRLEEDNGVMVYLKALRSIKEEGIDFEFISCGDGSLRPKIDKIGTVLGFVENVKEYINSADIIFASSYLSILNSLASKKVTFSVYENKLKEDYLKMAPFSMFIIISNSSTDLFNKLKKYLKNPQKAEFMAQKGYEWVNRQAWAEVVSIYLNLWKKR